VRIVVVGRGYVDAVRNPEVTFRSLGGGSKEKMHVMHGVTAQETETRLFLKLR